MMKQLLAALSLCLAATLLGGQKEDAALACLQQTKGSIKILCSPGLQEIPSGLLGLLGGDNPGLRIQVDSLENQEIEAELAKGTAAIALLDAPIIAPSLKPLAKKGLLFAVNESTGFSNIPKDKLDLLIEGKLYDWKELGMPKGPIRLYTTPDRLPKEFEPSNEHTPTAEEKEEAKKSKTILNKNPFLKRFIPVADEAKALALVAQDPCGFTIVSLTTEKPPKGVRFLSINGIPPDIDSDYPYFRTVQIAMKAHPSEAELALQTLFLSVEFGDELRKQDLLPIAKRKEASK